MLQIETRLGPTYAVRALRSIEQSPTTWDLSSFIQRETRCLEFLHARPAEGALTDALPAGPYLPLEAGQDPNCWFIECSAPISVATGAHNNAQMMDGRDLGGAAYMSKYLAVVKNNIKPEKSLSILYEALQHVARYPSVAPDSAADPASRRIIQW
jgi:hypothetical protein